MRVLQSWLKKYIAFNHSPEALAEELGMLGLEVEKIEYLGAKYDGFLVARVLSVGKHPAADRLTVCSVRAGKQTMNIVCGAPNVSAGQKVVVGLPGAVVPRNQHDPEGKPFELQRTVIRGVESEGMICSEFELGLGPDAQRIMVLPNGTKEGTPLAKFIGLSDVGYDIEVTPNRPDWLSHIGIAREIGILLGRKASLPPVAVKESRRSVSSVLTVKVHDRVNCKRFGARVLENVKVGPSPEWMQRDLRGIGLRPINNVVDVTNYVMMETGQPMHAFDLASLKGSEIHVRSSESEHEFELLDGNKVSIPRGATMICDANREISLAGIMGGANSGITNATRAIVLEAAFWNPAGIRRTAKYCGISTDASYRFERGTDPDMIPYALNRAAQLIAESAGGQILRGILDNYPVKAPTRKVSLRIERLNRVLGTDLRVADAVSVLRRTGLTPVGAKGKSRTFAVPGFRVDILAEIDLVEEVARVHGYDAIPEQKTSELPLPQTKTTLPSSDTIRHAMIGLGFREALTIPLIDTKMGNLRDINPVRILNPLSAELNTLRTSLIPGLLGAVSRNVRHGNPDLRLFEIGHVFQRGTAERHGLVEDFLEVENLGLCLTGLAAPRHWSMVERSVDLFDIKGIVESLLKRLSLDKSRFISYRTSDSLVEEAVAIEINGSRAGYVGKIRPELLALFDLSQDVFVAEILVDSLRGKERPQYQPIARYPRVRRDVAFVVDRSVTAGSIEDLMVSASSGLLKSVELFDLYEGDQLPPGKRNLAFALDIVSSHRTLTDAEIEDEVRRAVTAVVRELGAQLRA